MRNNIKAIVFDLDGTLYEDTHHFDYYADRLKDRLPNEKKELFEQDYNNSVEGNHTLKIGTVYDAQEDLVLLQEGGKVTQAFEWDGTEVGKERITALYPDLIQFDLDRMFNVGDLWWIPNSIARHYGLTGPQTYEAFLATRKYMMTPEFKMTRVEEFNNTLQALKGKVHLILLTNSPEQDSKVILEKLGLDSVFDLKIFEGRKPIKTLERFATIKEHFNVEYNEILSVGDNLINEILPVRSLDCATVLIDPHTIGKEDDADLIVSNISEVVPVLRSLL